MFEARRYDRRAGTELWQDTEVSVGTARVINKQSGARPTIFASGLEVPYEGDDVNISSVADRADSVLKRVFDLVCSSGALLFFAPLLLLIAAAIVMTSRGPALFRQRREGKDGKIFRIYKFRTMYLHRCDLSGVKQTTRGDSRITPIGRFLRKTSIDELPQLLNVLKGEMSLVGPRPHAVGMVAAGKPYDVLVPYYRKRLMVKPGLTGWAQANGLRGETTNAANARARIDHDMAYIANYSIWLDIKIILLTFRREFIGGNGY
jgi:polysaccharide biosynthesis protein PslA